MYQMKPEYYTGIEMIDQEHRHLFEIAESAYQLLHNEFIPDKYDNVQGILQELFEYTRKHFADEEAYMESVKYRRIFSQKVMHKEFIDKLESFNMEEAEQDPEGAVENLLTFLTDWLVEHILKMDMLIGK
ncbi:MAG: hemerythrin family protein [Clostridium sp.]|nr:hemerythrin family protein [Clostridium sp.]